jgi:hypothetical protein
MTDIVKRLKTFVAPENWDADQLIFDATKEIERLRSAKSDSSQLDIEVESLKARVKELEAALLDGVLMLSEMGLSPSEKCQMAYDRMSEALKKAVRDRT